MSSAESVRERTDYVANNCDPPAIARILIVDDDPGIRGLICAVLGREGYDYDVAEDGEIACHKLRRQEYGAVVLDLMLPKLNGFEVIRFLKAERPAMLPRVIVVTAVAETTLRDFADEKLVWRLLRKPFDIAELVSEVRTCTASSEEGRLVRRAAERVG